MNYKLKHLLILRTLDIIFIFVMFSTFDNNSIVIGETVISKFWIILIIYLLFEYLNSKIMFELYINEKFICTFFISLVANVLTGTIMAMLLLNTTDDKIVQDATGQLLTIYLLAVAFIFILSLVKNMLSAILISKNIKKVIPLKKRLRSPIKFFLCNNYAIVDGKVMSVLATKHYTKYTSLFSDKTPDIKYVVVVIDIICLLFFYLNIRGPLIDDEGTLLIPVYLILIIFFQLYSHVCIWKANVSSNKKDALYAINGIYMLLVLFLPPITLGILLSNIGLDFSLFYFYIISSVSIGIFGTSYLTKSKVLFNFAKKNNMILNHEESFIMYKDSVLVMDEETVNETERSLLFALHDNDHKGAVLLSGEWGSGKTYTIKKLLKKYEEVDLLEHGSGQNMFYAIYKRLSSNTQLVNTKINILNLLKYPELVYIIITLNLAWVPFIALFKEYFLSSQHLSLLIILVVVINLLIIQFIPEIIFSKDIHNNRFRRMYLDLIVSYSQNKVIVFENIDRLSFNEINHVLEIINYLNDKNVTVIVNADMDYLYNESKFSENKFQHTNSRDDSKNYFELYMSRYFKDIIYIPNNVEYKIKCLKDLLRQENVFVAPHEWRIIKNILNLKNINQNVRELEYFVKKYKSKPVENMFSYELFLHIFKVNNSFSMDFNNLNIDNKEKWALCSIDTHQGNEHWEFYHMQSSKMISIYDLFLTKYKYSNIPEGNVYIGLSNQIEFVAYNFNAQDNEQMIRYPITNIFLSNTEEKLYKQVKNEFGYDLIKEYLDNQEHYYAYNEDQLFREINERLESCMENIDNIETINRVMCKLYIDYILTYP